MNSIPGLTFVHVYAYDTLLPPLPFPFLSLSLRSRRFDV